MYIINKESYVCYGRNIHNNTQQEVLYLILFSVISIIRYYLYRELCCCFYFCII